MEKVQVLMDILYIFINFFGKIYRSLYLAYESGSFTDFQYQGVITCIPKEGNINFSDWAHSLNVILHSHKYFCSSVSLILLLKKDSSLQSKFFVEYNVN
jgi:hypothetical protein